MNNQIKNQAGAVLITALVILVLLTLLGLSTMSTTTLEERMAANNQNINRAFQAASSGLDIAYNDSDAFDTQLTADNDGSSNDRYNKMTNNVGIPIGIADDSYHAVAIYNSVFIQKTAAKRGSSDDIWDQGKFAFYHFDLSAFGCMQTSASASNAGCNNAISNENLHQGVYQVGNK